MKIIGVYGASGFGREVMPLARQQTVGSSDCTFVFIDDSVNPNLLNGHEVWSWDRFARHEAAEKAITIAIADSAIREKLARRCVEHRIESLTLKASSVVVMDDVVLSEGAILAPFVTLTSNIRIGKYFHANLYSYVAHDCVIGDFVTFAPAVRCNGNVHIEDHAYIGAGAILRQGTPGAPLVVGRGSVVGMGAVVTKSVAPGTTVVGNPARPLVKP